MPGHGIATKHGHITISLPSIGRVSGSWVKVEKKHLYQVGSVTTINQMASSAAATWSKEGAYSSVPLHDKGQGTRDGVSELGKLAT